MEIQIEKGIPIPPRKSTGAVKTAALRKLEVGDSFVIPRHDGRTVYPIARRIGIKVATRKDKDGNMRVWRVE